MSIIKRILFVALALLTLISFAACGGEDETKKEESKDAVDSSTDTEESSIEASTEESKSEAESSAAESSEEEEAPAMVDYTVKVVDADGNPVADASVQLCSESACFLPSKTDAEGVVVFQKEEGTYKACIAGTNEYTYFEDSTEITIVYTPAA